MILETERILLRPFRDADAQDVFAYARDPLVGPAAGWRPHGSVEESLEIIRTVFSQPHVFAVVLRETGRVIGSAGYVGRKHGEGGRCDELGYAIGSAYWGRGLMAEAVEELLRYGFEERGLDAVWCGHYEENDRSRRVVEKSGFTYALTERVSDDIRRDRVTLLYVMTRQDWERRRRHG